MTMSRRTAISGARLHRKRARRIPFAPGVDPVRPWRARRPLGRAVRRVAERSERRRRILPVELAFLEFMAPDLADGGARLAAGGATRIRVVPLFLGRAGTCGRSAGLVADIAALLPGVAIELARAAGDDEEWSMRWPLLPGRGWQRLSRGAIVRLFGGMRPLSRGGVARDALAGITLASMNIPQVLGYTRIAGTPVVTGLYTVLLPLVAFAVFGFSRHMVVAADSATAAIFASGLSRMAPAASERYMALVGMVALMTAVFLLLARISRLGFLADFLSRTVLVGFLAGVGVQVGITMLPDMLGLTVASHRTVDKSSSFRGAPPTSTRRRWRFRARSSG